MHLKAAAESLKEWVPQREDLARREQMVERFGQFAFGGFGIVLLVAVGGMIYTIITKMVLSGDQPWAGILLIAFIIFAVLALAYVMFNEDLKEKRKKARPAPPSELPLSAVTGKLLEEKEFETIPTVIEDTTELLPSRREKR